MGYKAFTLVINLINLMGLHLAKGRAISKSLYKRLLLLKIYNNLSGKYSIIFKKFDKIVMTLNKQKLYIYKGYSYRPLKITKFVCNYRFGEFVYTRKPFRYMLKQKKK